MNPEDLNHEDMQKHLLERVQALADETGVQMKAHVLDVNDPASVVVALGQLVAVVQRQDAANEGQGSSALAHACTQATISGAGPVLRNIVIATLIGVALAACEAGRVKEDEDMLNCTPAKLAAGITEHLEAMPEEAFAQLRESFLMIRQAEDDPNTAMLEDMFAAESFHKDDDAAPSDV